MVVNKLDLLEMPENERVQAIRELKGKLQHKISEKRSQELSLELDIPKVNRKRIGIENQRLSRICFGNITEKYQYSYFFTTYMWCLK